MRNNIIPTLVLAILPLLTTGCGLPTCPEGSTSSADGRCIADDNADELDPSTSIVATDAVLRRATQSVPRGGPTEAPKPPEQRIIAEPPAEQLGGGTLDEGFGEGGIVTVDVVDGSAETPTAVLVDRLGRVVVAGYGEHGGTSVGYVQRYLSAGILDESFADGGTRWLGESAVPTATSALMAAPEGYYVGFGDEDGNRVVCLDGTGRIDERFGLLGQTPVPPGKLATFGDGFVVWTPGELHAFDGRGEPSSTFGTGGVAAALGYYPGSTKETGDGGLLLVGGAARANSFVAQRFDAAGAVDVAFEDARAGLIEPLAGDHAGMFADGVLLPDGRVVAAGFARETSSGESRAYLVGLDRHGELTPTFGSEGIVRRSGGTDSRSWFMGVDVVDGRIIAWGRMAAAGGDTLGFVSAYTLTGELDPSFGVAGTLELSTEGLPVSAAVDVHAGRLVVVSTRPDDPGEMFGRAITLTRIWL